MARSYDPTHKNIWFPHPHVALEGSRDGVRQLGLLPVGPGCGHRGCVALIGYAAVLTWRPGSTELVKSVIRHREDETEGESRKRWRGLIPFLLPVFVLLAIINAIHLPKAAFVLWAATFIPIGAVDMGHWEHCKAVVRGRPEDPEIATMNRV